MTIVDDKTLETIALMEIDPIGRSFIESLRTLTGIPSEEIVREHVCLFWRVNSIQRMIAWALVQRNGEYLWKIFPDISTLMVWTALTVQSPPAKHPGLSPCGDSPNEIDSNLVKIWMTLCPSVKTPSALRYKEILAKIKEQK